MLLYGNLPKTQHWPQICIFISFYWSLKARTQVTFVWILPIKLVGEKNSTISGQWRGSVLSFIYSINIYWGLPSPCSWSWSWCCLANQGVQNLPRGPDVFSVDTWSKVEMMSWKKKQQHLFLTNQQGYTRQSGKYGVLNRVYAKAKPFQVVLSREFKGKRKWRQLLRDNRWVGDLAKSKAWGNVSAQLERVAWVRKTTAAGFYSLVTALLTRKLHLTA